MANIKIADWITDVTPLLNNPSSSQQLALMRLRDIKDGKIDIPDATSPFAFTLENSSVNIAAFLEANELSTRRQYPSVSQTVEDIYPHMSDEDYVDRFALPSSTSFYIMIEKKALEKALVLNLATGISQVTIPRNSEFNIEGITFSIQYPIDIKKLNHGGYQVTYNTDQISPLKLLTTNQVENEFVTPQYGNTFLRLKIPVEQFWIKSVESTLTSAKIFSKTILFDDSFYYARVFVRNINTNNKWLEIKTTHTDQTYDPYKATALLKVLPGKLNVFIPQIYFSNGLVSGKIRIDIYQTKGPLSINLGSFNPNSFSAKWLALDDSEVTQEVASFQNISEIVIYSQDIVNNGESELSLDELRARVINNSVGTRNLPITNIQIEDSLERNGFKIVKNVDIVTNRTFLATKDLIKPIDEKLITSAATSTQSLIFTMQELSKHPAVFDNGQRITLTPDVIYNNNNGQLEVVSAAEIANIVNGVPDEAVIKINNANYVYSPFYYCLDATNEDFKVRPYHLDSPSADIRQFLDYNDSTLLEANTQEYHFSKTSFGYKLTVQVKGNDNYRQLQDDRLFAQLYFVPKGEVSKAYINGTFVTRTDDGGAVFTFDFYTRYDLEHVVVSKENYIFLEQFMMNNLINQPVGSKLLQDFNIIYGTFNQISGGWTPQEIDSHLGQFLLNEFGYAITEEVFRLEFGKYLENLWAGSRSFPALTNYKKYEIDVPATYIEDIFEVDPNTGTIFHLDGNNNVYYIEKHKKGDIIYNDDGSINYAHRKGDIIYDSNGKPIPVNDKEIARQVDILIIEGAYYFSTDVSSSTYKTNFVAALVDWIIDDLARLRKQVLEETLIYYYPITNMGNLKVIGENGTTTYIKAGQSFKVRLFVNEQVLRNGDLRNTLTNSTIRTIDSELSNSVVSISDIETKLGKAYGSDVIAVEVSGLGGTANHQVITLIGSGDKLSIKKRATAQSDSKIIVEEDVTVEFILHKNTR